MSYYSIFDFKLSMYLSILTGGRKVLFWYVYVNLLFCTMAPIDREVRYIQFIGVFDCLRQIILGVRNYDQAESRGV